jgi:cytoskeletal protein RodZ
MALSQDEQRILAEIEQRLASDDPGLATSLATFRRPGPAKMLRSPRVRIVGSLFTVLLVAMVSLTVYAMIPFRALQTNKAPPATAGAYAHTTAISYPTSRPPTTTQRSSATGSVAPTAATKPAASTASATVTSQNATSQNATSRTSSSHPATSAAAVSKSQQSDATVAIRELIPTVNAKP